MFNVKNIFKCLEKSQHQIKSCITKVENYECKGQFIYVYLYKALDIFKDVILIKKNIVLKKLLDLHNFVRCKLHLKTLYESHVLFIE